ncbi:PerC family transcriptional regulator [Kluyvera genomosp. 3]|uniref:PerC family transcriptional regulator n=1 Tax=Kluyvera genomosp. 3 TaxID=2774055 RepID=A0A6G9RLH9_9ENTR|nr:PerC family transcriptional regulator [Kluyvera genomosp. 3]QIR27814.1 PerC family transcriptional regulator [Kluyvera genomosp. 3]
MTKKNKNRVTQAQLVLAIVDRTPDCVMQDICEALDLPSSSAGNHLRQLYYAGKLGRINNGTQYVYQVRTGVEIPDVELPEIALRSVPENLQEVQEAMAKAKALESKGLWRRAATAYTSMMGMVSTSGELWDIARQRKRCLRNAQMYGTSMR